MPMPHLHRRLLTTVFGACLAAAVAVPPGGHAEEVPAHTIGLADVDRAITLIGAMGDYFGGLADGDVPPQVDADWTQLARNYRELGQGLTALVSEGRLQIADLAPGHEARVAEGILFIDARLGGGLPAQDEDPAGYLAGAVIAGMTQFRQYDNWNWFVSHARRAGFAEYFRQDARAFARALARRDPNGLGPIFVRMWFLEDRYMWAALQLGDAGDEPSRQRWAAQKFRAAADTQQFLAATAPKLDQAWQIQLVADWRSFRDTVAGLARRRVATAELPAPAGIAVRDAAAVAPTQGAAPDIDGIDRLFAMLVELQTNQDRLVATILSQQAQIEKLDTARADVAGRSTDPSLDAQTLNAAERDELRREVALLLDEIEAERNRTGSFAAGVSQLKLPAALDEIGAPVPQVPLGAGGAGTPQPIEAKFGDAALPGSAPQPGTITWRGVVSMIALAAAAIAVIAILARASRPGRVRADHVLDVRELLAIAGPALGQASEAVADRDSTLAPEFLGKVIRQFSLFQRRRWAESLAGRRNAARDLVAALASDEIEVARALLLNSSALGDAELIDIVRHRSEAHRMHVALRRRVSATVADALVATGNSRVIAALLENDAAQISGDAMERIVDDSQYVKSYHRPILRRPNLAPHLARRLHAWASAGIRREISERYGPPLADDDNGQILADVISLDYEEGTAGDTDTTASGDAPAAAPPTGAVTPQLIVDALRRGQLSVFERLFGEVTGLSAARIGRVISDRGGEDLAIACRALGIEKLVFASIFILSRKLGVGAKAVDPGTLARVMSRFEGISEQAAARTLSQWREDGATPDMSAA